MAIKDTTSTNSFDLNNEDSKYDLYWKLASTGTRVRSGVHPVNPSDENAPSLMPKRNGGTTATTYENNDHIDGYSLSSLANKLNKSLNIYANESSDTGFALNTRKYNRFKVAQPQIELQNAFAHVFFTRPECNLLSDKTSLHDQFVGDPLYNSSWQADPDLIRELTIYGPMTVSMSNRFMYLLSNHAKGFALNDEELQSDVYGRTYTGYKISYGKNNVEAKTAGSFQITFGDDRDLHVYRLHKLWVEYIAGVYKGRYYPLLDNIANKTLDYVCSVYYILTDETGERVLFWSKYYGVYPTVIPSSQYSWEADTPLRPTSLQISYNYSFKEDYNPTSILDFNINSGLIDANGSIDGSGDVKADSVSLENVSYLPTYDPNLMHVGETWVGTPFIERKQIIGSKYAYFLRFTK